jgi:glycosidase
MSGRGGGAADRRDFQIAATAREKYDFREPIFRTEGERIVGDLQAARTLAHRMNALRPPERAVRAGHLYTIGLIEELLHRMIRIYVSRIRPGAFAEALARLRAAHADGPVGSFLATFPARFPPPAVYRDGLPAGEYAAGETDGYPHSSVILEEALLLSLANRNPGYAECRELFDEAPLAGDPVYAGLLDFVDAFFRELPPGGPAGETLIELLRAPSRAHPRSLEGQLGFILERWGGVLAPYLSQILTGLDVLREENRPHFTGFGGVPSLPPGFRPGDWGGEGTATDSEYEAFSADRDWMSTVVMLAKSVNVWLHQLSVRHGRHISRLDQVPDAELDLIAARGFTALWLIGVWERSAASREIKRRSGNPEAEASAYSLYDYAIAAELGGEDALLDLRQRAAVRGIRLASDMVPNHTGIFSRWVVEHPDWYVQLDHPPFPSYRFTGPDLSPDPNLEIMIEDGYWSRTDAAVVFRHFDRRTGRERFIYHGNDGTGLPWNDTAQLNYLLPEVRQAVTGTILHVASLFPIIRFDAAMTLTRRHYRRLWFPPPGTGGDIPSRAGHGLPAEEFDRRMPAEFWREVVDRAAAEAPDTLLLAEAFWLLEGYFVRTLGMHRVYNSAFMNMLKREQNAEYRHSLAEVLDFDPEVLKRFVNFMNNPDEDTAIAQFGSGDKYFGTAVLLATLPGLPMVGHGQIEGFTEKYGMEYKRAYKDETEDVHLVARHEREIFPLFRRRRLFADAGHFVLYDLVRADGRADGNVFAYSNRHHAEGGLVVFNNVWGETSGRIHRSVPRHPADGSAWTTTLADELRIFPGEHGYVRFRDEAGGLEYLRPAQELVDRGLSVALGAFRYHVFLDFRMVVDETGDWAELCRLLDGRGVPDLDQALRQVILTPLHQAFRAAATTVAGRLSGGVGEDDAAGNGAIGEAVTEFLSQCRAASGQPLSVGGVPDRVMGDLIALAARGADPVDAPALAGWLLLRRLGELRCGGGSTADSRACVEEFLLWGELERFLALEGRGADVPAVRGVMAAAAVDADPGSFWRALLLDADAQASLGFNWSGGILWLSAEGWERFAALMAAAGIGPGVGPGALALAARRAGYRVDDLLAALESGDGTVPAPPVPPIPPT